MDKNSKKNEIAVFGATGLIGSILIKYLKQFTKFKKINLVLRSRRPKRWKYKNS